MIQSVTAQLETVHKHTTKAQTAKSKCREGLPRKWNGSTTKKYKSLDSALDFLSLHIKKPRSAKTGRDCCRGGDTLRGCIDLRQAGRIKIVFASVKTTENTKLTAE